MQVQWSVGSCHTVLGYNGEVVAVRISTAIVIPGRRGLPVTQLLPDTSG